MGGPRAAFFVEELSARSSVMLGPVPSICDVSIYERLADSRHKATVVRFKFADEMNDIDFFYFIRNATELTLSETQR
jgi:hypothetical protein